MYIGTGIFDDTGISWARSFFVNHWIDNGKKIDERKNDRFIGKVLEFRYVDDESKENYSAKRKSDAEKFIRDIYRSRKEGDRDLGTVESLLVNRARENSWDIPVDIKKEIVKKIIRLSITDDEKFPSKGLMSKVARISGAEQDKEILVPFLEQEGSKKLNDTMFSPAIQAFKPKTRDAMNEAEKHGILNNFKRKMDIDLYKRLWKSRRKEIRHELEETFLKDELWLSCPMISFLKNFYRKNRGKMTVKMRERVAIYHKFRCTGKASLEHS
jgi:hypothetical protein